MAEDFAIGKALVIPQSVLNNINKLDEKINLIASDSEKMATHFSSAMTRMGGNAGELLTKLQNINNVINNIGSINAKGIDNVSSGLGKTNTEAEKVANSVTEAAVALNRFSKTWQELGGRPQVAKSFEILTNKEQLNLLKEARNEADAYSRSLSEANKKNQAETKASTNAIKEQMQAEKNRHDENIARLKQEGSSIKIMSSSYRDYVSAITMSEQTETSRTKKIERMNTVLEELRKKEIEYSVEIDVLTRKINSLTKENERLAASRQNSQKALEAQAKLESKLRRSNYQSYVTSTEGSLRTADKANTYAQRAQAIKNLEAAIKKLRTTDANYQNDLKRLSDAHKRLSAEQKKVEANFRSIKGTQSNLMNTSDQLARKLALIFSVSQIEGYVNKLVRVRGEFELQNTALASILQNKDKADKLFGQITDLAVKSPFTLKELVTYTKSLSAYSVEYDKLYDTTKMLADVSSGLGVDMQRIILAFGQVKAANFLRGTETRQFTEAGINMLGELAKYYSELEGRMVSVGEVQERQFKRMISFQDVEEVFKRLTSAGGMFYNMQERQAETLAGMMSNLQDSIDIMLNDIGKSNDSIIKDMVKAVRSIIENWQEVVYVMKPAITVLGAYKAITLLASIGTSNFAASLQKMTIGANSSTSSLRMLSKAMTTLKNAAKGLAVSLVAMIPVAIISGIFELTRRMTESSRQAKELQKSIQSIGSQGVLNASELSANFERIANKALSAADGSKEQKAALDELNRTYADIIPSEQMTIENLKKMEGQYESVTSAIYAKIEAQTKEKQLQEVSNLYGEQAVNSLDDLARRLTDYGISLSNAKTIVSEFKKEFDKGFITTNEKAKSVLESLIKEYTQLDVSLTEKGFMKTAGGLTWGDIILDEVNQAVSALTKFSVETEKITKNPLIDFRVGGATPLYEQLHKELELVTKEKDTWDRENKDKFQFKIEFSEESKNAQIKAYEDFISDINRRISTGSIKPQDVVSANLVIEEAQKAIDKLNVSETVSKIDDLRLSFSKLYDIDFGELFFTKMSETEGLSEYIKRLDENIQGYKETIDVFNEAASKGIQVPMFQAEFLLQGKALEEIKEYYEALTKFREAIAITPTKNKSTGENSELKKLKEQISLIKKAGDEYEKLRKYYSEDEAKKRVVDAFREAFAEVGVSIDMDFDIDGIIKAIENLKNKAGEAGEKEMKEAVAPLKAERDIKVQVKGLEEIQKRLDEVFAGYELSVELKNLGLDENIIGQLFNIDTFTLDDVKKNLDSVKPQLEKIGRDGVDVFKKTEEKIADMQQKELEERLKKYADYLKKSVSERMSIEMEAQKKISEVQSTSQFTDTQKKDITDRIKKERDKELDSLSWKEFQESDMYIQLFEELEYVSTSAIISMKNKLAELKDSLKNLSPEQLKEINNQIKKLEDIEIQRNPFKFLFSDDIKEKSKAWQELGSTLNEVANAATDIASSLENVFGSMSDKAADAVESFSEIASGLGNTASGVGRIMAGDYIGGGIQALTGIFSTIGSIFNIGDKKKEREIQRQLELVDDLQRAYEKLEKAIDDAYSIDTYKEANDQAIANLKAQNDSLQASIAAEQDKKKTDDDRIKEWQQQIEDNNEAIEELVKEQISTVTAGILDDGLSAADAFVDAWLEAFQETGDGLSGLEDNFNEMLLNMIKRQAAMSIMSPLIDNMQKELEKYINKDDTELTINEAEKFAEYIKNILPQYSEAMENYLNAMKSAGIDFGGGGDTMTGLSKSISSITEDTAEVLASITESIRYFTSDSNTVLHNIYNLMINPPVENPFLSELKVQSEQLRLLYGLFNGIIKNVSGSGKAMSVRIV